MFNNFFISQAMTALDPTSLFGGEGEIENSLAAAQETIDVLDKIKFLFQVYR